jgi:hypothetical protein
LSQVLFRSGVLAAALAACGQPKWVPPDQQCPAEMRPVWLANPHYSMCVATSFRTRDLRKWVRERAGGPTDVLTVQADAAQTQVDLTGGWPPHLRAADSLKANQRVVTRSDTTGLVVSHTELLASGPGDTTSTISFVSGIRTADGQYMIASGESASAATLDTLLLMFRTVTRAKAPDPNRRSQ